MTGLPRRLLLIAWSFNAGRLVTVWSGFSLHWYAVLWRNTQLMQAAGVPSSPVRSIDDLLQWRQLQAREMVLPLVNPLSGQPVDAQAAGFPIKFSGSPAGYTHLFQLVFSKGNVGEGGYPMDRAFLYA